MSVIHAFPLAPTVKALRSGRMTVLEAVILACDRIDAVEPTVEALLPEPDRRARLLGQARELMRRYPKPASRPPLYGVLVGVKDIFHADGFETRAGSTVPASELRGEQSPCLTSLLEAGALLLGKTVTTEFAYYEPGRTRNPHDPARTPGGSSSGSAAAVAAGFCPLALGTQTIGSVIRPAAYCGVVGFKPTQGRLSTEGVLPFSRSADQPGLFTQDVAGMALAASVVCADWQTVADPGLPVLGVPVGAYLNQAPARTRRAFEAQVDALASLDWPVRYVQMLDDIEEVNLRHRRLIAAELAEVHADWFERYRDHYRFRTADLIRTGQAVTADELEAGRAGRTELRERLAGLMAEHGIDVWLSPAAMGPADVGLKSTGDPLMNLPWTHAGLPTVTVPAALTREEMPLGLQMTGAWMGDEKLLHWAKRVHADLGPAIY